VSLELGGKSANVFFADVLAAGDEFADKAAEGFTMLALNQGEVCDEFLELAVIRTKAPG